MCAFSILQQLHTADMLYLDADCGHLCDHPFCVPVWWQVILSLSPYFRAQVKQEGVLWLQAAHNIEGVRRVCVCVCVWGGGGEGRRGG